MEWFLGCLGRAIDGAQTTLAAVLAKARFWDAMAGVTLNDRQRPVVNRLLDGFEGKLTSSRYARFTKCSQDTAARDIASLVEHKILVRNPGGGRSTSYSLARPEAEDASIPRSAGAGVGRVRSSGVRRPSAKMPEKQGLRQD